MLVSSDTKLPVQLPRTTATTTTTAATTSRLPLLYTQYGTQPKQLTNWVWQVFQGGPFPPSPNKELCTPSFFFVAESRVRVLKKLCTAFTCHYCKKRTSFASVSRATKMNTRQDQRQKKLMGGEGVERDKEECRVWGEWHDHQRDGHGAS